MSGPVCSIAPTAPTSTRRGWGPAEEVDASGVGRQQAEHHVDRRGLPGAVRPEQGHGLAGGDRDVHPTDRVDRPLGGAERLVSSDGLIP